VPSPEEREAHEAEIRRRWDAQALLSEGGATGADMAAVIDAILRLDLEACRRLEQAYWDTRELAGAAGVAEEWERAFRYSAPYPDYPGDLYAIDPWSRMAFNYAGLLAREQTWAVGAGAVGIVPVERAAMGMVLALSVRRAREGGWFHPVSEEMARWLARPWRTAMGEEASAPEGSG